jgi:hypothetical protein
LVLALVAALPLAAQALAQAPPLVLVPALQVVLLAEGAAL